ncbi:FmdB family zinc ribbon protein [Ammoniphilus sp. CFH 90114]|uniref:FmdB family zinc ribbon protein n=1 Tax=Ammoniphilus sp. CFH 90114 TaxID=2493665 RepID=UPI00100F0BD6|nr:FmdB family zinc ribbon protein [Ammoniphilus sp. CFH 90114]RXT06490.1 hypothetical protein EIZ39_15590 [Ammoniphilus sp. CFH 90114]
MPLYGFRCNECGDFQQWIKLADVSNPVYCPNCSEHASRIFTAPGLSMVPNAIRKRMEYGAEPKLVSKSELDKKTPYHHHNHHHHHDHKKQPQRPWQIGH